MTLPPARPDTDSVEKGAEQFSGTISGLLESLLGPLEGSPLIYSAVVAAALLLLLWVSHLVLKLFVVRPLLGHRLVDRIKVLEARDLTETKVLSSISTLLSLVNSSRTRSSLRGIGASIGRAERRPISASSATGVLSACIAETGASRGRSSTTSRRWATGSAMLAAIAGSACDSGKES